MRASRGARACFGAVVRRQPLGDPSASSSHATVAWSPSHGRSRSASDRGASGRRWRADADSGRHHQLSWMRKRDRCQGLCHSQSMRCTLAITEECAASQESRVRGRRATDGISSVLSQCTARRGVRIRSRQLFRFQRGVCAMRTFPVPGVSALLCYHDLPGDEPTIVFLHGLGAASSEEFMQTVRHPLLAGFRMLLVDFLGFGFSERPVEYGYTIEDHAESVAGLLHDLNVGSAHIVGHSMGGSVAIALAMRHADLVVNLVVAEGNLDPGVGTASAQIAAWSEEDYIRDGHLVFAGEFKRSVAGLPGYGGVARTVALASPHAMHRSARSLLAERSPTFREGLENLPMPRTYLIGERSSDFPEVRWPRNGVNVVIVPEAGHVMNVDNPDGFARAIAAAVATAERGAASARVERVTGRSSRSRRMRKSPTAAPGSSSSRSTSGTA